MRRIPVFACFWIGLDKPKNFGWTSTKQINSTLQRRWTKFFEKRVSSFAALAFVFNARHGRVHLPKNMGKLSIALSTCPSLSKFVNWTVEHRWARLTTSKTGVGEWAKPTTARFVEVRRRREFFYREFQKICEICPHEGEDSFHWDTLYTCQAGSFLLDKWTNCLGIEDLDRWAGPLEWRSRCWAHNFFSHWKLDNETKSRGRAYILCCSGQILWKSGQIQGGQLVRSLSAIFYFVCSSGKSNMSHRRLLV